ncbi:MAG: glutamine synthetase type III, partial [Bacillota bacterium]
APPAIISIFVGDQLQDILGQLENGGAQSSKGGGQMEIGVTTLPALPKDATDRNRTSPFAFTGNKFEFRMVPSAGSIAGPNFILNTIVAEVLDEVATRLEKASNVDAEVKTILKEYVTKHKRVVFNGNGYSDEWVVEAEKRGLPNIKTTVEATKALIAPKNIAVMEKYGVLSKVEMESRYEVSLENYIKTINIEALTMIEIAKRQILPAVIYFATNVADSINSIKATGVAADVTAQTELLTEVSSLTAALKNNIAVLEKAVEKAVNAHGDTYDQAALFRFDVFEKMAALREVADALETLVDADVWPMPTYGDLLFNI